MPFLPPLEDPAATLREALRKPIGHEPLGETVRAGERICIIVNDSTRVARSDVFLPILIFYYPLLVLGVDYAKVGVVPPYTVWIGNLVLGLVGIGLMRKIIRY